MASFSRRDSLVLVGHGSAINPQSGLPTLRIAAELRRRGIFGEVHACFLKEPPFLDDFLSRVGGERVFVVPNFAGKGRLTREVVPGRMGLSGPVSVLAGPEGRERRVHYAEPVGCHPQIPRLLGLRAESLAAKMGKSPQDVSLLLIAHGSRAPGGSSGTPESVAGHLRRDFAFGEVVVAYLEQEPRAEEWPRLVTRAAVVAAPLLIAEGLHGSEDIPPLFGLLPGESGPVVLHDRQVCLCRGIGSDPEIAEIVLALAAESLGK